MDTLNYNQIEFLKSANHCDHLPPDLGAEVAFSGRSNAGKSSAINTITNISRLAKTSKTPGRTQLINFFEMDPERRLVDLPGYGYAKVPTKIKQHWEQVVSEYICKRESLRGIVLIMDIRHPLKPIDWQMLEWTLSQKIPLHILLTKADKLKRGAAKNTLLAVRQELEEYTKLVSVQLFSSLKKEGMDVAREKLDEWLQL